MSNSINGSIAAAALAATTPAFAAIVVLDFEGIGNSSAIVDYYGGGAGTDYGIAFAANALGLIDRDAGGTGNIANEPTPDTVMFFLNGESTVLNYAAGFTTGFSFFYSAEFVAGVTVYDGVSGSGNVLASINLEPQANRDCAPGSDGGYYCNWTPVGLSFAGTARSVDFAGTPNYVVFDNITFGSATPVIPEPSTCALMLAGLGGLGIMLRRRRPG